MYFLMIRIQKKEKDVIIMARGLRKIQSERNGKSSSIKKKKKKRVLKKM